MFLLRTGKTNMKLIVLITSFTFCVLFDLPAQEWFSQKEITDHISVLASDSLGGRATGTSYETKAANYIITQFKKAGLTPKGTNGFLQEFPFKNSTSHGAAGRSGNANNVIGYLDNSAPLTIIIGAHYDHLGTGEDGNSLDGHADGKIHNGADDNASGVAGVIELADYYSKNKEKEPFNFLFICFSGEELGLFGSAWFVDHPVIDFATVNCMINMDMIGRLNKEKPVLTISGTGTAKEFEPLVKSFSSAAMEINSDSAGVGPSDHTSFYNKGIPALHFFTGTHIDYHKPSDDIEKINAAGEEAVLLVISGTIAQLPVKEKLAFLKTRNPSMGGTPAFKVTLGIMPSYSGNENGLKVEAVLDGKAAFKAGMKDGDVIIQMGEQKVTDIQTYMEGLGKFNKGDKVTVIVRRGNENVILNAEF